MNLEILFHSWGEILFFCLFFEFFKPPNRVLFFSSSGAFPCSRKNALFGGANYKTVNMWMLPLPRITRYFVVAISRLETAQNCFLQSWKKRKLKLLTTALSLLHGFRDVVKVTTYYKCAPFPGTEMSTSGIIYLLPPPRSYFVHYFNGFDYNIWTWIKSAS